MKKIKLSKLNSKQLTIEKKRIIQGGLSQIMASDNTDVNTTSGDSYSDDNSSSSDSYKRDSLSLEMM